MHRLVQQQTQGRVPHLRHPVQRGYDDDPHGSVGLVLLQVYGGRVTLHGLSMLFFFLMGVWYGYAGNVYVPLELGRMDLLFRVHVVDDAGHASVPCRVRHGCC